MFTLNCNGKLISAEMPLVMGIINATPDSFYKGDLPAGAAGISALAKKMIAEGADILDIGGQSTRPGSARIQAEEEMARLIPVISMIAKENPGVIISADTYSAEVAAAALQAGATIINDISGGDADAAMIPMLGRINVPYICMHMKGSPENMQAHAQYENAITEVLDHFIQKQEQCRQAGIKDLIIDLGFGFAKTAEHNFLLLKELAAFKMIGAPILAGLSRKSTVYKTLGVTAGEALNGTTVLNTLALHNGADILRVHDVKEAKEAVALVEKYKRS